MPETPREHLIAQAIAYHKAPQPYGEGEYGCPGATCPGVQRLVAFGARCVAEAFANLSAGEALASQASPNSFQENTMPSRAADRSPLSDGQDLREVRTETAPGAYRKKPVVIQAAQWFKNGDHPDDNSTELFDYPSGSRVPKVIREGAVVRYFQRPDVPASKVCQHCGITMHEHGWIDTKEGGHIVCPGDWIITGVQGERYPCKPDIFAATYEPAAPVPSSETAPRDLPSRLENWPGYLNGYDAETEADQRHAYNVGFADAARAVTDTTPIGSAPPSGWQTMESAPRNATWILGLFKDGDVRRVHYAEDVSGEDQPAFAGWFYSMGSGFHGCEAPIGWMPMPFNAVNPPAVDPAVSRRTLHDDTNNDPSRQSSASKAAEDGISASTTERH